MRILSQVDPEGCVQRKRHKLRRRKYSNKGPNYVWHADGYDKIKPYGFCIHGCIDGFSRKILWLKVGTSNNNPYIVAHHFITAVEQLQGTPCILRCDLGTENTNLAFIQPFLRRNCTDCYAGEHSFRYGRSVSNQKHEKMNLFTHYRITQRIEAWWAYLKRSCTQWWIELFQEMKNCSLYDETNYIHRDCLRFCFMHLIQKELDSIVHEWNSHRIRVSKNCLIPGGIPDELFFLPQVHGTNNYIYGVNCHDLSVAESYAEEPDPPAPLSFLLTVNQLMTQYALHFPNTIGDAMSLYAELVALLEDY